MKRRRYIFWMRVVRFAAKRAAETGCDRVTAPIGLTFDYHTGTVSQTPQTSASFSGANWRWR